ncbi:uncharacterized protein [Panulirus ornatus]|uniref:uncharacterized protein n=1 Tax=Panulirus ornatus TaxID=150431 RepID=UPI003A8A8804
MWQMSASWQVVWLRLACLVLLLLAFYVHLTPTRLQPSLRAGDITPSPPQSALRNFTIEEHLAPWWDGGQCQCQVDVCVPKVATVLVASSDVGGTCGRRAWAAGVGQQVVAFSLYGENPDYWHGLHQILSKVRQLYPGWLVRLYTDPSGRASVLCPLLRDHPHLHVCDVTNLPPPLGNLSLVHPMMWRVAPLGDPQVTAMIVRDSDSQVSEREAVAVRAWLGSGKSFHVMRDHPAHTTPILGGMWGARWGYQDPKLVTRAAHDLTVLRNKMLNLAQGRHKTGEDQHILRMVLWPAMVGRVVAHDSYTCLWFPDSKPWPTQRVGHAFVGSARFRREYVNSSLSKTCPVRCRPPEHRDWIYC